MEQPEFIERLVASLTDEDNPCFGVDSGLAHDDQIERIWPLNVSRPNDFTDGFAVNLYGGAEYEVRITRCQ